MRIGPHPTSRRSRPSSRSSCPTSNIAVEWCATAGTGQAAPASAAEGQSHASRTAGETWDPLLWPRSLTRGEPFAPSVCAANPDIINPLLDLPADLPGPVRGNLARGEGFLEGSIARLRCWARALAGAAALARLSGRSAARLRRKRRCRAPGACRPRQAARLGRVWNPRLVAAVRLPAAAARPRRSPSSTADLQAKLDAFRAKQAAEGVSQEAQIHRLPPGMPGIMRRPIRSSSCSARAG